MTSIDLCEIFNEKVIQLKSNLINIEIVPDQVIKLKNPQSYYGFSEVNYDSNDQFIYGLILIDEKLSCESKLNVLLHEYGHLNYSILLGHQEIQKLRQANDYNWVVTYEYEAYKYQLNEIKYLAQSVNISILLNSIEDLKNQRINNPDARYKAALDRLALQPLWQECLELIG